MKSCPQCGKAENEISMTTDAEKADDNSVSCTCGFTGKYGDLKSDKPAKAPKAEKADTDKAEK